MSTKRPWLVENAKKVAHAAHTGQVDKAGHPYITHPERVAARVRGDARLEAIAWLHDTIEDTPVRATDLRLHYGFPDEVVDAVIALTKKPGEPLADYYRRVAANPLAKAVKLADIADNSDPERLALLDDATQTRLETKYAKAREALAKEIEDGQMPVKGAHARIHRHPDGRAALAAAAGRARNTTIVVGVDQDNGVLLLDLDVQGDVCANATELREQLLLVVEALEGYDPLGDTA